MPSLVDEVGSRLAAHLTTWRFDNLRVVGVTGDDAAAWAPVLAAVEGEVQARMEGARAALDLAALPPRL